MALRKIAKKLAGTALKLRVPRNVVHRVLAYEYLTRRVLLCELQRLVYFQPMFESLCRRVGPGVRLEICPDSKLPAIWNCEIELGREVKLSARTTFSGARNAPGKPLIRIGDYSYVGHRCVLRAGTELIVGKHVLIASNALISGDPGHPLEAVARRTQPAPAETLGRIEIGDDVWIAYNVSVLGNVRIGEGAVIAANSVVVDDVPPHTLVAGNPARVIRSLIQEPLNQVDESGQPVNAVRTYQQDGVERPVTELFEGDETVIPPAVEEPAAALRRTSAVATPRAESEAAVAQEASEVSA